MIYRDFEIYYNPPPIPIRGVDYQFAHVDYDGPEDRRIGMARNIDAAKAAIDEMIEEADAD